MVNNEMMRKLLEKLVNRNSIKEVSFSINYLEQLFNPPLKNRYDCLIISDKPTQLSEQQFGEVIKSYGDKTGYEASNTEVRINDFISNSDIILDDEILRLALLVINIWSNKIKAIYPSDKFCFIISISKSYATLRFHKVRENEGMWLSDDLEKYEEAVGYIII